MNYRTKLFLFLIVLVPSIVFAASPILNFSDIISGPSTGLGDGLGDGAIVTVWGNNLGSSQGSSTITIDGETPAYVYYWKNANGTLPGGPADLYTYHKMQEIAFSIPSSLSNGTYSIKVTVEGKTTNPLPFTVRDGSILHVKTTGSSGGNGSWSSPYERLYDGRYKYKEGDIVYSHDGVKDINTSGDPSGSNGTGILFSGINGTIDTQIAFIAYPNSRTLIQGTSTGVDVYNSNAIVLSKQTVRIGKWDTPASSSTTILDKDSGNGIKGSANGRVVANDISQITGKCVSGYAGAIWSSSAYGDYDYISNSVYFGNYVHDWGCPQTSKFEHTTYMSVRNNGASDRDPFEFAWNLLKDNEAKYGIHIYDENWNAGGCGDFTGAVSVHDNYVINQRSAGIDLGMGASTGEICWTNTFNIYNNVLVNTGLGPTDESNSEQAGIRIGDQNTTATVNIYNNTIYSVGDNTAGSAFKAGIAFLDESLSGKITVKISNNIFYDTIGYDYMDINESTFSNISGSNNLWYSTGGTLSSTVDSRLTSNTFDNPDFVSTTDFQLTADSPAVDAGTTGIHDTDFLQVARPQGASYDIGAYEYYKAGEEQIVPPVLKPAQ